MEDRRRPERSADGTGAPNLVTRTDLLDRLDRATAGKVVTISAPAGSGKTSLLRGWGDRYGDPGRLAMVQVRRDQRDAQDFWLALLDAVRRAAGTAPGPAPAATAPHFSEQAMAGRILSELADAGADGDIMLVIDDLQELNAPETLSHLSRVLTNLPPRAHAILSTRRDLPLRLHQLRLTGELTEIRAADLRFSEDEARELLTASGVGLSPAGAAVLHQRTEGWAAGLRLAALSLAGHPDPERFVAQFSGSERTVAEYLLAEMLERQPGDVQHLLLSTCLLDRVNGELADLMTGRPGSEQILLDLEDANAFVVSLDPERTWFRCHHLFGDLLRLELRRTRPGEVPALHRRAAAWFSEHGQVIDAIRHTLAAGEWAEAARLLADHSLGLTLDGHTRTMQALLRAFPPGASADPELALAHATGELAQGHLEEAAAHLTVARSYVETASPERGRRLRGTLASLDLWLARRRGQLSAAVGLAAVIDPRATGQWSAEIALDGDLRAMALLNLGIAEAWSQRAGDGERHLQRGAELARKIGRPYLEVSCLAHLGFASKFRSFSASRQHSEEALALAERYGWGADLVAGPALMTLACAMIWAGEFNEGERRLRRAAQILQADSGPDITMLLHLVTGMLHAARGRHDDALQEFSTAEYLQSRRVEGPPALANLVTGWMLATEARLGRPAEAHAALAALPSARACAGEIRNADAVICLAQGDPAAALGAVRDVLEGSAPVIGDFTLVESHLLSALAHRQLNDQRAARTAAERALALAEAERIILPFAVTDSAGLLKTLPRHETAHAALLAEILDDVSGTAPESALAPPADELSPTELRVLRYLPTNMTRSEIARELSVSLNTVSTHVRRIYAKLGADDRSAAVHRARGLGLLSSR